MDLAFKSPTLNLGAESGDCFAEVSVLAALFTFSVVLTLGLGTAAGILLWVFPPLLQRCGFLIPRCFRDDHT